MPKIRKNASLFTPGVPRHVRLQLASIARRDERVVAKWLRGENVSPRAGEDIANGAAALNDPRLTFGGSK